MMKARSSKLVGFLSLLCLAVWPMSAPAVAQTAAGLDLQLYAGLSITGTVGTVYSVEFITDLAQTNDWRCLAFLQLPPRTTCGLIRRPRPRVSGFTVRSSLWRQRTWHSSRLGHSAWAVRRTK